jgi:hypothetical protein
MAAKRASAEEDPKPQRRSRPATTLEGREQQLVALAVDVAEKQLRDGTASAQVITHFLRLGTTREQLEQEKLKKENRLLEGRTDELASKGRTEEMYKEALSAMREYGGYEAPRNDDDDED